MDDAQFANRLLELWTAKDTPGARAFIAANGGMSRVIALAVRGAVRAKRDAAAKPRGTFLPDTFPDDESRAKAITHWRMNRRPDLEAQIERHIDNFRAHFSEQKRPSWPKTWNTWFRNQVEFTKPPQGATLAQVIPMRPTGTLQEWRDRGRIYYGLVADCAAGSWNDKWGIHKPGEPGCAMPAEAYPPGERPWEAKATGG